MYDDNRDQAAAIWNGLIGYTRASKATPEQIFALAPTFPQHMLGSTCRIEEEQYNRIAYAFIGSDDYKKARDA